MQIGSVVWEEFDQIHTYIHTYIHTEFGQCGSQYTRNAQYQTCFAGFDNNNNNLRLLQLQSNRAIIRTVPTSATQGVKQQPPRRAALCTEGLSRLNCCHTRRTAIESTAPA